MAITDAEAAGDCQVRLEEHSRAFRQAVGEVADAVADRLGLWLQDGEANEAPFLMNDVDNENRFTIDQVIRQGDHLEHFHCYYSTNPEGDYETEQSHDSTIDWHTDQGMMLMFAPGQQQGKATDGFFIQLADGSTVELNLDVSKDDLIVMLGDGVNQYVNPKLKSEDSLRAVPHALKLAKSKQSVPRVWYGRMVLPPPQAVHPYTSMTFGDIRSSMINGNQNALALGCASNVQVARELADGDEDEIICSNATSSMCWHQCMNYRGFSGRL
ncbi:MAG: hypothetical protein SGARI_000451 [Bacillariaceae sp.]